MPDDLPPVGTDDPSAKSREIVLLRKVLPPGSERRMVEGPGDNWSYDQASPAMREEAVLRKFESAAGPSGRAAARDRRYLTRYIAFCMSVAVSTPFPVGSIVFLNFAKHAAASSSGKRGGATVEYSIKVSFLHMRNNFGLDLRFDSPLLFNTIKPYKGDSDSATSPSLYVLLLWERGASEDLTEAGRLAFAVAVLACHLTLRASHFVGTAIAPAANERDVRLTLGSDKDGSAHIWAGCAATGINGPFKWWPSFLVAARARGYLVPAIKVGPGDSPSVWSLTALLLPTIWLTSSVWLSLWLGSMFPCKCNTILLVIPRGTYTPALESCWRGCRNLSMNLAAGPPVLLTSRKQTVANATPCWLTKRSSSSCAVAFVKCLLPFVLRSSKATRVFSPPLPHSRCRMLCAVTCTMARKGSGMCPPGIKPSVSYVYCIHLYIYTCVSTCSSK